MKKLLIVIVLFASLLAPRPVEAKANAVCNKALNPRCEWVTPDYCDGINGRKPICKKGGR